MKKLGKRNYTLMSMSLRELGWWDGPSGAMMYEEQMYASEGRELWRFAEFLYANKETVPFGPINYEQAFKKFKEQDVEPVVEHTGLKNTLTLVQR